MRVEMVPATLEHAQHIAAHARPEDVAELWASSHAIPLDAMTRGLRSSSLCFTGLVDDEPTAMIGVVPFSLLLGYGSPWMVATPLIEQVSRQLLRVSRAGVAEMAQSFPWMVNFVDARNDKAIRWLAWLGFTIHPAAPHGVERRPFHCFEMRAPHV